MAVRNPGLLGLIGAPSYPMLRDVTQRAVFDILNRNSIPYEFQKQEHLLTLKDTGSEIIFRSLLDPEAQVGTNLAWFGVDEMTYCKEASFHRLQARLRHPLATELCGFGVWTPNGFDWVYERFINPSTRKLGYEATLAKPGENSYLPSDFYQNLLDSYDERFAKQEVYGDYLSLHSGAAYYAFNRTLNVKPQRYNPNLPLCWSLDFNINPMCSVICQIEEEFRPAKRNWLHGTPDEDEQTIKTVHVLDEIWIGGQGTTPEACEEFFTRAEHLAGNNVGVMQIRIYGDASGTARQTASAGAPSDWETVKRIFGTKARQFKPTFLYKAANPGVKDRIGAVNAALSNHERKQHLFIDPRCTHLMKDLERVTWKPGTALIDKDTDQMLTHISDALGYLVEKEMKLRASGGWRSERII